jgi:hypothetical protein
MNEEKFSLAMTDAEAKEWHNSRGLPWGTPFAGPAPKTISRMAPPDKLNQDVHLANEHGRAPDYIDVRRVGREISHALFHLYGIFREGQEHYHGQP